MFILVWSNPFNVILKYISEKYIQSRLKVHFPIFSLKEYTNSINKLIFHKGSFRQFCHCIQLYQESNHCLHTHWLSMHCVTAHLHKVKILSLIIDIVENVC